MILPYKDDNPVHETPWATYVIIGICVLVYLYQASLESGALRAFITAYGFVPGSFFGHAERAASALPDWMTLFTSMFMHGDFMHLAGNMLYLWIFTDNIETAMCRWRFVIFYLLCGVAAALAHAALEPTSMIPMVGASGAISGMLGAYLLLYPKANVRVFFAYFMRFNVPAWIVLGGWFLMQFIGAAQSVAGEPGVAFWAHIGGFVAGMIWVKYFLKKGEHLFHQAHSKPWEKQKLKGPWEK